MFQIVGIESELQSLSKCRHDNPIKYYAMNYTQEAGKITVHVSTRNECVAAERVYVCIVCSL